MEQYKEELPSQQDGDGQEKEFSVEEVFQQLDEIIKKMEGDVIPLDEAFALYEAGLKKLKQCNEKLDLIEKKMLELSSSGEVTEFQ